MGLWPFGRKKDDHSVEALLAEANVASPTGAATEVGTTGDGGFRLTVEDVFSITGRGTVVTGRVETGTVRVGLEVTVVRNAQEVARSKVTGVEMFRKVLDTATVGDNVGLLLAGLNKQQLDRGDLIQG
jgi:translation elongation factor EF-Tu-like GTPase